MIPWVREKFAESRLRWQNRKQRNENYNRIITASTSTVAATAATSETAASSNTSSVLAPIAALASTSYGDNSLKRPISLLDPCKQSNDNRHGATQRRFEMLTERDRYGSSFLPNWTASIASSSTSSSSAIIACPYDLSIARINIKIINNHGITITLYVPITMTAIDVKQEAIHEFRMKNQLPQLLDCDTDNASELSQQYKLIRMNRIHGDFDETVSLVTANIQNNEEFLLIRTHRPYYSPILSASNAFLNDSTCDLSELPNLNNKMWAGPTQNDIDLATVLVPERHFNSPAIVNIDELVLQSDVQYDIRKTLISLSNLCAHVIGAGPYASKLIFMLKQRLIRKKRRETDTLQYLMDMGFSKCKAQHALQLKNNSYAAALEWLIENQSPTNFQLTDQSPAMNLSGKFLSTNSIKDNIEALLEIVRIYYQRETPPTNEMIQLIIDMGFDETMAREALKATKNNQSDACEWLVGNRSKLNENEQNDGLPSDSPILKALLGSPHVQLSLSSPKMFLAYLSILEDYSTMSMWLSDSETSGIIGHILRTYHEEKHILAINQFNPAY